MIAGTAATGEAQAAKSVTPAQTEGPFYPDMDNDLTRVQGAKKKPAGKFIYVHGTVYDKETRVLVTQARFIFTYAVAYEHLHNDHYLQQQ